MSFMTRAAARTALAWALATMLPAGASWAQAQPLTLDAKIFSVHLFEVREHPHDWTLHRLGSLQLALEKKHDLR